MKNFLIKIKTYFLAHKIISAIIIIIIIVGGYWGYQKITNTGGETRYVLSPVTSGTIVSSIADSGQVSALNQVNITPTVSGALTAVNVKPGDNVKAGQTLFVIDDTSAQKTVRDAQISLQNANLALQKLQLQNSDTTLNTALAKAYDDGFTSVSNTFLNLPGVVNGLNNMFFTSTVSKNGELNIDWYQGEVLSDDVAGVIPFKQQFSDDYKAALASYTADSSNYQSTSRSSDSATLEKLISQTYDSVKLVSTAIKSASNYINFVNASIETVNDTPPAIIAANQTTLNNYTSQINTSLQNLLSIETEIQNAKDSFTSSTLDTQSAQIAITQAQNSLSDAEQNLSYYHIKAPFDGVISSVPVIKGANVGSGTTLATIITSKELATVSLSETDVAKVALGQKATLTFDAIPDLTIAGQVVEIDSVGTVSQGVVNYNVQISFDATSNDGVKPGMSVNAAIITDVAQNVLTVPSSAVKIQNGASYVQVFDTALPTPLAGIQGSPSIAPPRNQTVTTGISDGSSTQIVSGLKLGDEVVTKTITSTTKATATTAAPSILGGGRVGGGAVRIGG
jgi:RND family efflux transporter MFP subunit